MSKQTSAKKQQTLFGYFKVQEKSQEDTIQPLQKQTNSSVSNSLESLSIDNEEEEEPILPPKRTHSLTVETDKEEDLHNESPKRRKKFKKRIIQSSDDDDDDTKEDLKQPSTVQCDINDDLLYLDKSDILEDRTRGKQVSRYTKALQKLKDRKAKLSQYDKGEKGPIESYTIDSDDSNSSNDDAEEEEGFVVDDDIIDGEKTTAPDSEMVMLEMPPEFSKGRVLSFNRQLEIYIEYLVQLVLNPVFDVSSNARYKMAKIAVTRRVQSYKDSMVTSDVWLSSFKEAVDRYSQWYHSKDFVYNSSIKCQACRANKPASAQIILFSDDTPSSVKFYLGKECCRKGEMYHQLNHFASHMYNKVKKLVNKARNEMMMSDRGVQEGIVIYNELVQAGYIKKLTREVKDSFNIIVRIYNLRGHRSRVEDTSSSSEQESD